MGPIFVKLNMLDFHNRYPSVKVRKHEISEKEVEHGLYDFRMRV